MTAPGPAPARRSRSWLPLLPIVGGALLLASLARHPAPPTHFVGDAGVKVHLMDGWVAGGPLDNRLDWSGADPWVRGIWERFHFPFEAPFVRDGQVVFQALFPLLSLPAYALLGYPGLFVLPVLATLGLWLTIGATLRRAGLSPGAITRALSGLVLSASTFFGMTFWEHVPALWLLALAIYWLWTPSGDGASTPGSMQSGAAGLALVIACVLRPELALTALPLVVWLAWRRQLKPGFVAGAALGVVLMGALNVFATGTPLGLHRPEVFYLEQGSGALAQLAAFDRGLLVHLALGAPFATGALLVGGVLSARAWRSPPALGLPVAMALAAVLLIPFLVPYTGEYLGFRRFELAVLPLGALVAGFLVQRSRALAVFVCVLVVLQAAAFVRFEPRFAWGYTGRVRPLYEAVVARAPAALISNSQYPFHELSALLPELPMFWGEDASEIRALCEAVAEHVELGDTLFVWLNPPDERSALELEIGEERYRLQRERLPGEGSRPAFGLFRFVRRASDPGPAPRARARSTPHHGP